MNLNLRTVNLLNLVVLGNVKCGIGPMRYRVICLRCIQSDV
jgi:hypothetical protein